MFKYCDEIVKNCVTRNIYKQNYKYKYEGRNRMKEYQNLIGRIIIAVAIIIAGFLISQAIITGSSNIFSGLDSLGTLIRDGLLQLGSES